MVSRQLVPHDGELAHGRVQDPLLQSGIVGKEEPEERGENEQQGKSDRKP